MDLLRSYKMVTNGDAACTHHSFLSLEPTLSEEDGSGVKASTVAKTVTR